jgi:two-component sensor histidine kinase
MCPAPSFEYAGGDYGFLYDGGRLGVLIRAFDWSKTSLGPISDWPRHLKASLSLMLPAKAQIVLFWGPDFVALYNDAYAPTIGDKHPRALGRPARENWAELWDDLEPLLLTVRQKGETVFAKDRPFCIERHGYPENVSFDLSYSPVRNEQGAIEGVLCIVSETTERVLSAERERLLMMEQSHRIKNLLSMIDALIALSAKSADTVEEMSHSLRRRFKALIAAKDLARPGIIGDDGVYRSTTTLDKLVQTLLQPYTSEGDRILVKGPAVEVGPNAISALALTLHESATNAVKYGALSAPQGRLRVEWDVRGENLHLHWDESGGPVITTAPTEFGFGSVLAERSIVRQLGGRIEYDWNSEGLKLTSIVPLTRLSA